jgi:hypothetical protein
MGEKRYDSSIPKATINLTPQKSVLPLETMSQFAETVIPDELLFAGRDPWFDRLTTLSEVEGESSVGSI